MLQRHLIFDKPGEKWCPVVGYEDYYEVSSLGRIKALPRLVPHPRNPEHQYFRRPHFMATYVNGRDRFSVKLRNGNGRVTSHEVHMLVARAFLGPLPSGYHTHHIDGNALNNSIDNLCYMPAKMHMHYTHRGQNAKRNVLTEMDVHEIRMLRKQGLSSLAIAKRYGVVKSTVLSILNGKSWAWLEEGA